MYYIKNSNELSSIIGDYDELTIIGNGPSLKVTPAKFFEGRQLIGMNRIDQFIKEKSLHLEVYVFVTDNIENDVWGEDWLNSLYYCCQHSNYTIISIDVFNFLKKNDNYKSKEILDRNLIVLNCLIEPKLYSSKAVVKSGKFFTKSGTSLNLASQIALSLNVKAITYCGVDLGWKTTSKSKQHDPNHYQANYFARIQSGYIENCRMHSVHDRLLVLYQNLGILVRNYSPLSTVEVYDNYDFEDNLIYFGSYNSISVIKRFIVMSYSELKSDLFRTIVKVLRIIKLK